MLSGDERYLLDSPFLDEPAGYGRIRWAAEIALLESLGNLGDFLGGIGVLITLLYLAGQVRQNTRALNTASRQDVADSYVRNVNSLFVDEASARTFSMGLSSYPDLPFKDRSLFGTMMNAHSTFFQSAFAMYESGNLPEETYTSYRDWIAALIVTPGGATWWADIEPSLPASLSRELRERVDRGDLFDVLDGNAYRLDEPLAAQQSAAADST